MLIAAAEELVALVSLDAADPSAPLFRDPASNRPLSVAFIRATVKKVAAAAGLDPSFFGAHSLRYTPQHLTLPQVAKILRSARAVTPSFLHSTLCRPHL